MYMIENELLVKLAKDFAQRLALETPSLEAACLVGSVVRQEPSLGDSIDINIIGIDSDVSETAKPQLVYQSETVLITYLPVAKARFTNKKLLRRDPFLGPAMYEATSLYDTRHQFDLIQAGLRSNFFSADNMYYRARAACEKAQQTFQSLAQYTRVLPDTPFPPADLLKLNRVFDYGMTAVLMLARLPASGRRHMIQFERATRELDIEDMYADVCAGLGYDDLDGDPTIQLMELWQQARSSYKSHQLGLDWEGSFALDAQTNYYLLGAQTLNEYGYAHAALLSLEATMAEMLLETKSPLADAAYSVWLSKTNKGTAEACQERVQQAKQFLERLDEFLLTWANAESVSPF